MEHVQHYVQYSNVTILRLLRKKARWLFRTASIVIFIVNNQEITLNRLIALVQVVALTYDKLFMSTHISSLVIVNLLLDKHLDNAG